MSDLRFSSFVYRFATAVLLAICTALTGCSDGAVANEQTLSRPRPAKDFVGITRWLNSEPLTMSKLRGKVVLVEFWTRDCSNCLHTLPHIVRWYNDYRDRGFVVVGVHTPEFSSEYETGNVKAAVEKLGIRFPVAQDNEYETWNAYGNQFWPASYLVDQNGMIVYAHFGEGNYEEMESRIRKLLAI